MLTPAPSIFGTGLAYPMQLDATKTRPAIASEQTLVQMSMMQIVNTDITERPFLTKNGVPYGTRIRRALFADAATAIDIIQFECKRALDLWEPRIIVRGVVAVEQPQSDGGSLIIATISFVYRSTGRSDNLVVPFQLTPGSG